VVETEEQEYLTTFLGHRFFTLEEVVEVHILQRLERVVLA
jgi:hypothetical protein